MPPTVLLVDDDPAHLYLYARVVREAGFRVITARIGQTYLSFPNERPALVLMDYGFSSELTPRQVLELIRGNFPSTPVLIFSARPELPEEMKGLVEGFVRKDSPEDITIALTRWIQRAKGAQSSEG